MQSRYNRNKSTRNKSIKSVKKNNSLLQWIFAFFLGYLFAYIFSLESVIKVASDLFDKKYKVHQAQGAKNVKHNVKFHEVVSAEPKYEFYTMLQKNDSEVVTSNIKIETESADPLSEHNKIVETQNLSEVNAKYPKIKPRLQIDSLVQDKLVQEKLVQDKFVVQIAAFSNHNEAESLKAKLALLGYQINIFSVKHLDNVIYRVFSQDFNDANSAELWLKKLFSTAHIHGIIRKKSTISK